jgi:hypothetical protein
MNIIAPRLCVGYAMILQNVSLVGQAECFKCGWESTGAALPCLYNARGVRLTLPACSAHPLSLLDTACLLLLIVRELQAGQRTCMAL